MGLLIAGSAGAHDHVNAGARGSAAGAQLYFVNGDRFAAESGYVVPLEQSGDGPQAGYYRGSITFTALPSTLDYGGPAFDHAAPGARLELVIETVEGPAGGRFGFWEGAGESEGTELTFEVPAGTVGGTERFWLTEGAGEVGADPYGHVHGRVFTATDAGLYEVGLRIRDVSSNGSDGGALHPLSDLYHLYFQAGVSLARLELEDGELRAVFGAATGFVYQVEQSATVGGTAVWSPVGGEVVGDNHLRGVTLPQGNGTGFFRIRRRPA